MPPTSVIVENTFLYFFILFLLVFLLFLLFIPFYNFFVKKVIKKK